MVISRQRITRKDVLTLCAEFSPVCSCQSFRLVPYKFHWYWTFFVMYVYQGGPYFGHFRIFARARAHMVRNKKKKNIPQVSSLYLNFSPGLTAMQVSHLNNMGFLALNYKIFNSGQSNCLKNLKLCRLYPYNSYYPSEFLQIFSYYNFGIYYLLTLRYNSILSSCNSKIIIAKNLQDSNQCKDKVYRVSNFLDIYFGRNKRLIVQYPKPHAIQKLASLSGTGYN